MSDEKTTDTLEFLPFEDSSRREMIDHLREYHGYYSGDSKINMKRMMEIHSRSHDAGEQRDGYQGYNSPKIKIPHKHVPLEIMSPTEIPRDLITSLERPLTSSERKAMTDLVNNDFAALKAEIQKFGSDIAARRAKEVQDEWAAKSSRTREFQDRTRKICNNANTHLDALVREADEAGIELTIHHVSNYDPSVTVRGYREALNLVAEESRVETQRALLTLERQRLTALRQILLSCITKEALAILGKVPTAHELMAEAGLEETRVAVTS